MGNDRRKGLVNQRTFEVRLEGAVEPPAPTVPTPPPDPPPPPPAPFREVVSSSDQLWERRFRWLRDRGRMEAQASTSTTSREAK